MKLKKYWKQGEKKYMFENNIVQKRLLKRKQIMDDFEKAKNDGIDWKVRQLESKLYMFNRKHYPNVFWNSAEKGTYRKPKEKKVLV